MKRFIPLLLPLALVACSPNSPSDQPASAASSAATATSVQASTASATATSTTSSANELGRYHWQLTRATDKSGQRIDALFANADKPLQLDFNKTRVSVSHTCNHMGGSYQLTDGKLSIGPMAQTMMACHDDALMTLDKTVRQVLQGSLAVTLKADDQAPQLTLVDANGDTLVFTGQPTAQTRYGSAGQTLFLEVAAQPIDCAHPVGDVKQCLKVRERHFDAKGIKLGKPGQWHALEQPIEGYTHKDGVRNVLRLKSFKRSDAPADAASTAYVLDMVVESAMPDAS